MAPWFGALLILSTVALSATNLAELTPTAQDAYEMAEAQSVQVP